KTAREQVARHAPKMHEGDPGAKAEVLSQEGIAITNVRILLSGETETSPLWKTFYFTADYQSIWMWPMINRVLFIPSVSGGPSQPFFRFPINNTSRWDHRLALHDAINGVLSYLAIIKLIEAEYRSTQRYKEPLEEIAKNLDAVIEVMRQRFARTEYKSEHF